MGAKIRIAIGLGLAAALALLASSQAPARTLRIAVATFSHETCTFCPDPTTVADWEFYRPADARRLHRRRGVHRRIQADVRRPRRDRPRRDHFAPRLARRIVGQLAHPGGVREIFRPHRRGPPPPGAVRRRFPRPPRGHGRDGHPQARGGALPPRAGGRREDPDHGHARPPRQRGPGARRSGRRRVHHQALPALRHGPPGRAGRAGHGQDDPGEIQAGHVRPQAQGHHPERLPGDRDVAGHGDHGAGPDLGGGISGDVCLRRLRLRLRRCPRRRGRGHGRRGRQQGLWPTGSPTT